MFFLKTYLRIYSQYSEEQLKKSVNNAYKASQREAIDDFLDNIGSILLDRVAVALFENIVSINGKPWQETEGKDFIITHHS